MKKLFSFTLVLITLVNASVGFLPSRAEAASASEWKAGRIIDDSVFTNASDMSVSDIQNFLNSKVPECDTYGTKTSELSGGVDYNSDGRITRAEWARAKGYSQVFTCLRNFYEVPKTSPGSGVPANNYGGQAIPAGAISAAQIIYNAAQRYQINPKVILVTIQKESYGPLTTDTWPLLKQYTYALGSHCPDGPTGAQCDPNYSGFSMQVESSAQLMRNYLNNMTQSWWPYKKPYQVNSVLWNVTSTGCGAGDVYIETKATAALYTYTPYQPNQAALNNMYGSGDRCSAYGNRNFWRIFKDWFGTTLTPFYSARVIAQSPYPTITSGASQKVSIRYINQGTQRWYDSTGAPSGVNPVQLAATSPINRISQFSQSWPSGGRPNTTFTRVYQPDGATLALNQHAVEPGEQAVWEFDLTIPTDYTPGIYRETFQPVLEGNSSWAMGGVAWLDITVKNPYVATLVHQSSYSYSATQNSTSTQLLRYRNDGEAYWYDTLTAPSNKTRPFVLSTLGESKSILSAEWPSSNRASSTFSAVYLSDGSTLSPFQHVVRPGEIVEFKVPLTVADSHNVGQYRQILQPIIDGYKNGVRGGLVWFDLNINALKGYATLVSQSGFPSIQSGAAKNIYLAYRNNTNSTWYDRTSVPKGLRPMHIATFSPINKVSAFSYDWFNRARPSLTFAKVTEADGVTLTPDQHLAEPGQVAFFSFNLTAPWAYGGEYREYFLPILEGSSNWYQGGVSWMDIKVTK